MLTIKPLSLKEANSYVAQKHRHNKPTSGHKYSIGCFEGETLHGVAIVGRPLARMLDDGLTIEVLRVCTDGTFNCNSKLYGACARIAKEMGYHKIITYTLLTETEASLRASGWKLEAENIGGGSWSVPSRPRQDSIITLFGEERKYPTEKKRRWVKILTNEVTE